MKIHKYPDGTSYVELDDELDHDNIETTFRVNTYEDLHHLVQYLEVLNYNRKKASITIPWLIDGQADRRFAENQSRGLGIISETLNRFNPDDFQFTTFHPHNPEVVEATFECIEILDNSEFIRQVANSLLVTHSLNLENLVWLAPDAGAYKWINKTAETFERHGWPEEVLSASKYRKKGELRQQLPIQDFEGKDVLIIDDCCIYGGTFKGLSKMLDKANVGRKFLAVSHMTVQNLGEDPVTNYFDTVFTTNSKYEEYFHNPERGVLDFNIPNLEIINMF